MALSLVGVGAKITAAITNAIIGVVNAQGMTSVIPTSVAGSGVSVGAAGKVTFTAATTISLNGCFTSTYENYLVVFNSPTASVSNALNIRFRAAGTDDTTANYDAQGTNAAGATVTSFQNLAGTSVGLDGVVATIRDAEMFIIGPALAAPTRGESKMKSTTNPMTGATAAKKEQMILHRSSTPFDGFTIIVSTGTATGTIRVYGYNNE